MKSFAKRLVFVALSTFLILGSCSLLGDDLSFPFIAETVWPLPAVQPKLPIGMNVNDVSYWSRSLMFTDVMKTSSTFITFTGGWDGPWDTAMVNELNCDANGYPLGLPQRTSDGIESVVRFLINNYYTGLFRIDFEGEGELSGAAQKAADGNYYVRLDGSGNNTWISILRSNSSNHVRNIQIVPTTILKGTAFPTFYSPFLEGLRPFHALRFMETIHTNGSLQVHWTDRVTKSWYTQSGPNGVSFDYLIELCNELKTDAWICVPHGASDDYMRRLAVLWRDKLEPGLKIYLEYSNEIWNWQFSQATYIDQNAPGAVDAYVSTGLVNDTQASNGVPYLHYKFGWMMRRLFNIWEKEFAGQRSRLITVGTGQHVWTGLNQYVLEYLFDIDGGGCDAFAIGGYFSEYPATQSNFWSVDDSLVPRPENILDAVYANMFREDDPNDPYDLPTPMATRATAELVHARKIPLLVYEGGQHMQPLNQQDWAYNPVLWAAHIHPKMYQLYQWNFAVHVEPKVQCELFMAFNYVSDRKSRYGSWGHLENLNQIGTNYATTAPKYRALLDANTPK